MKLYKISQPYQGYDTYDAAVVAAETSLVAIDIDLISPASGEPFWWGPDTKVEYIGQAKKGTKRGIICASFNAG